MPDRVIQPIGSTSTPSIASATTALAANKNRLGYFIQNLGTNALFVREGLAGSTSVFNYVLAAGSVNDDGTGGSMSKTEGSVYTGVITIAGTSPRYTITEYYEA